ncbi:uncharacterized protein [Apostichopus japonicus]|uniref:uncharacterized protein isoform X1 n=2 Tax=Stichopus japonicus TaxID=307972 RepID=UPI003AB82692
MMDDEDYGGKDLTSIFKGRCADITNIYIPKCRFSRNDNAASQGVCDSAEKSSGGDDRRVSVCKDVTRNNRNRKTKKSKEIDVDQYKDELLETYFQYYSNLWSTSQREDEASGDSADDSGEDSSLGSDLPTMRDVKQKHRNFNKAVKRELNENTCIFYKLVELYGEKLSEVKSGADEGDNIKQNCKVNVRLGGNETRTMLWSEATLGYLKQFYPYDGVYRIPAGFVGEDELTISKKTIGKKGRKVAEETNIDKPEPVEQSGNETSASSKGVQEESRSGNGTVETAYEHLTLRTDEDLKKMYLNVPIESKPSFQGFCNKRRGDIAEEEVLKKIEEWGRDRELNMFMFGGYEYKSFLANLTSIPYQLSRSEEGEFDILIICQQIGLIIVEVKSTFIKDAIVEIHENRTAPNDVSQQLKNTLEQLLKGWKQLMKGNFIAREMNRDLSFVKHIPASAFLVVPNISKSGLDNIKICQHHRRYIVCRDDLSVIHSWLDNRFPCLRRKDCQNVLTKDQYRTLVSRFVGHASAVVVETETIKSTNNKMTCLFMNPEQESIVCNKSTRALIFGDYGTGKSLVLMQKALSLGKPPFTNDKRIRAHIISCADVSNFKSCYGLRSSHQAKALKSLIGEKQQAEHMICYGSFLEFHTKALGTYDGRVNFDVDMVIKALSNLVTGQRKDEEAKIKENVEHHFFFDEFPIQPLKNDGLHKLFSFWDDFNEKILRDQQTNMLREPCYLWLSVATHSLGVAPDEDPYEKLKNVLPSLPERLLYCYLNKVMRVPGTFYNMIRKIETFIDKGHGGYSDLGHSVGGIMPRLYRLPQRQCEDGETLGCECECSRKRLTKVLKQIMDSLDEVEGTPKLQITLMLYYVMSSNMFERIRQLLEDVCNDLSIKLEWDTIQYHMKDKMKKRFTDGLTGSQDGPIRVDNETCENHLEKTNLPADLSVHTTNGGNKGISCSQTNNDDLVDCQQVISGMLQDLHIADDGNTEVDKTVSSSCQNTDDKNKEASSRTLQVVDQRTFAGCETSVLIFLDPFEMRHWFRRGDGTGSGYHSLIFTRCTGHFILITWPKDEAGLMWEKHLEEYREEVNRSDATDSYKYGRFQYIAGGRKAHFESPKTCLDMLLEDKCMHNVQVE